MNDILTIITPTYNRVDKLHNLYKSLTEQTCKDFVWLVVDDGSTDDTKEIMQNWIDEAVFELQYIYQKNAGKHSALNTGVREIKSKLTFIVDSDDILTTDAVSTIIEDYQYIADNKKICGIGYLRGYSEKQVIGDRYTADRFIGNFIQERTVRNVTGDKAEVWKTEYLKAVPFPEIPGEKFLGESYVWNTLAKTTDMLFINKIIYITEYLEGGLTKSGRKLRISCPIGGMLNSEILLGKEFDLKTRVKGALLFVAYGKFAGYKYPTILEKSQKCKLVLLFYVPGVVLYHYWKKRYMRD